MKRINFALLIGTILLMCLLLVAFFPQRFTNIDPNYRQTLSFVQGMENGQVVTNKILSAPWGPTKENIMGTDEFGRDIYSRLIYGTKVTLNTAILVVLFRLLIAVPLGILAGIGSKSASVIIRFFNTVFTAIPLLLVTYIIFNIGYFANLHMDGSIVAFAVVLSIAGWGKLGKQIETKVDLLMKEDFIEGEVAIGKTKLQMIIQNILPHLLPFLTSISFIEVGLSIFLLAQLSVLEVFVGPRRILERNDELYLAISAQPEWASILSRIAVHNRIGNYWIGIYPALAFSVGILAFNLTGEGLRIEFEKRTSKIVSLIRKLGFVLSPRIYIHQILKIKEYYKPVIIKTTSIGLVIVYLLLPAQVSLYPFNIDQAMEQLNELVKSEYGGRLALSEGNYLAGEYIVNQLKKYGLQPYDGENYIQEFRYFDALLPNIPHYPNMPLLAQTIQEGTIRLTSRTGEVSTYRIPDDFTVAVLPKNHHTGEEAIYTGTSANIENLDQLLESNKINSIALVEHVNGFKEIGQKVSRTNLQHSIYFWIVEDDRHQAFPTYTTRSNSIAIVPKGELAKKIASHQYEVEVTIKQSQAGFYRPKGRNILAVLPGKDWGQPDDIYNKKEIIIIGAPYDGLGMMDGKSSAMRASSAAINLEIARTISQLEEPLDKTIIFAFYDGDALLYLSGSYYFVNRGELFSTKYYNITYLDVGHASNQKRINIDVKTSSLKGLQVNTYKMTEDINKRLKKQSIPYTFGSSTSKTYRSIGINLSLKISAGSGNTTLIDTKRDTPENINKKQMKNIGQFFIDLITMDEHFR